MASFKIWLGRLTGWSGICLQTIFWWNQRALGWNKGNNLNVIYLASPVRIREGKRGKGKGK